ncbi:hypothetical protein JHK85_015761 [Glycine max]|nr:hypothetical protein JHK85_015761 [Glycine max]
MGNSESMYESQDNFYQHPPSYNNSYHQPSPYAENSENNTYHEPSSYAGTSSNTSYYQPSTHPGSKHSFHRKSLHHIGNIPNPYEQAISIIGHTLSSFDEDNLIPCFGFGDDGPWDEMKHFDDNISERLFDNFQVLKNEYRVFKMSINTGNFSAAALMEIPFQYRAAQNIQLNDRESVLHQHKRPFPPPNEAIDHDNARMAIPHMTNLESAEPTAPAAVEPVCPICLTNPKDMASGCGHTVNLQGVWLDIIFLLYVPAANYNSPETVHLGEEAYLMDCRH